MNDERQKQNKYDRLLKHAKRESSQKQNKNKRVYVIWNEHGWGYTQVNSIPYIDEELGFYLANVYFMNGEECDA